MKDPIQAAAQSEGGTHLPYLAWLLNQVPTQCHVLDVGGGLKGQLAHHASAGCKVHTQPLDAIFEYSPEHFDGIIAFHTLNHLDPSQLQRALHDIARWLTKGGVFFGAFSCVDENHDANNIRANAAPGYLSDFDANSVCAQVRLSGLELVRTRNELLDVDGQPVFSLCILAWKRT